VQGPPATSFAGSGHPGSRRMPGVSKVFTPPTLIDGVLDRVDFVTEAPSRHHFSLVCPPLTFTSGCWAVFFVELAARLGRLCLRFAGESESD